MSTAVATATPTTLPPNPSPNLTTVLKFMKAANSCDVNGMLAVLSDTSFGHELAPENYIKQSGFSVVRNGKEEFKDGIAKVLGLLKSPGPVIQEVIESETKIVVHARGAGATITGHPYTNEYIFIFTLQPSINGGEPKISYIKEFIDSLYMSQFFVEEVERIKKAQEGQQG